MTFSRATDPDPFYAAIDAGLVADLGADLELTSVADLEQLPAGSPPPSGIEALLFDDTGLRDDPTTPDAWRAWVAATNTENWLEGDPLLDWLDRYGAKAGLVRDDLQPGYDPRTDFKLFLDVRAARFEAAIIKLLGEMVIPLELPDGTPAGTPVELLRVPKDAALTAAGRAGAIGATAGAPGMADPLRPDRKPTEREAREGLRARSLGVAGSTVAAMATGAHLIAGGVLRNPHTRAYGAPDLLIRSDVLEALFPGSLPGGMDEAAYPAPGLDPTGAQGIRPWHYVILDVKFRRLELIASGHVGSDHRKHAVQVWLYSQALARIQGHEPTCAFLLGRGWRQGKTIGDNAFERLGRVDTDHVFGHRLRGNPESVGENEQSLPHLAEESTDWCRRVSLEGASWQLLPAPSVPELFPNAGNTDDAPWHIEKRKLALELGELTMLPGVSPKLRRQANLRGMTSWWQPEVSAASLEVANQSEARCDAILTVNRQFGAGPGHSGIPDGLGAAAVLPTRIERVDPAWRTPAKAEFYVDFETVSSMDDDCSKLPAMGGQPLIFQIGCGWLEYPAGADEGRSEFADDSKTPRWSAGPKAGQDMGSEVVPAPVWRFAQWTVDRLNEPEEARIISAWVGQMQAIMEAKGAEWRESAVFHWAPAETSSLEKAYNSARERHKARAARGEGDDPAWPELPWFDFLTRVVKAEPVVFAGAFNFGLKSVAKAAHAAGLIETIWGEGPTDGLGAMVGAWSCEAAVARGEASKIGDIDLAKATGSYNEVDVKVMSELMNFLRQNR